jgi:hypothetical protein
MEGRAMGLQVICNADVIKSQINEFNENYHEHFFCVRSIAKEYLNVAADSILLEQSTIRLAEQLISALKEYGAGRFRKAPPTREEPEIKDFLCNSNLHNDLSEIAGSDLCFLCLQANARTIAAKAKISSIKQFDKILLSILDRLSKGLFKGNTNVTYPMKALLLITGFMPAFDSNVKRGLYRAGFIGFGGEIPRTRFLLPQGNATNADMKKLTRLPFVLGDCWANNFNVIKDGIKESEYPNLIEEPGRLFDVLFFMQGKKNNNVELLRFQGPERWYEII